MVLACRATCGKCSSNDEFHTTEPALTEAAKITTDETSTASVLEALGEGVIIQDLLSGHVIDCNEAACHIMGVVHCDFIGKNICEINLLARFAGRYHVDEEICSPSDKPIRWLRVRARPLFLTGHADPYAALFCIKDITACRALAAEADALNARSKLLFETTLREIIEFDPVLGTIRDANGAFCSKLRYSLTDLHDKTLFELLHVADRASIRATLEKMTKEQLPAAFFEARGLNGDKSETWFRIECNVVAGDRNKPSLAIATFKDITDQKHEANFTAENEALFRTMADSIPHLACIVRADGRAFWYNKRWYDFMGKPSEEMQSWDWRNLHDPKYLPEVSRKWNECLAQGIPFEMEYPLRSKEGISKWFLTRIQPIFDVKGKVALWFGTSTDIDIQKRIEQELSMAKSNAELSNRKKSTFVASVTHELRTPLSAMLGFADLLRTPDLDEDERARFLDVICRNGEQLSQIINDLLDLAKIEANQLALDISEVGPKGIAQEVLTLMSIKAKQKNVKLNLTVEDNTPDVIMSDGLRIRQILVNVVGNALKFTENGTIEIIIRGETDQPIPTVRFDIVDTGIGIPPEYVSRIFEMFAQADKMTTRKYGGTGLGLALSRRIAESLGGGLSLVESEPGVGSRFSLRIRNHIELFENRLEASARVSAEEDRKVERGRDHSALSGRRVLVVDDSPELRQLFSLVLKREGMIVDLAENGQLGVDAAMHFSYDAVLMDLQMPIMDGYAAARALRSHDYHGPILALTAHAMSEIREECSNAGFTDHLSKPINSKDLISTLSRYVH
jgi:PAS domain S-box-containing protein